MNEPLLFDTHILLWAFNDDQRLPAKVREVLSNPEQVVLVSAVSIWEMSIKRSIGKLKLPDDFFNTLPKIKFEQLNINFTHAKSVLNLPLIHQDPFDRMLIAQANVEHLTLVTVDKDILRYDVAVFEV